MISFPASVAVVPLDAEREGRGLFRLAADMPVQLSLGGRTIELTVPAGYVSDGASIPWWARGLFDIWGRDALPALLHDWLLDNLTGLGLEKWEADLLLYYALRAKGVAELHAGLMYLAVRTRRG